MEPVNHSTHKPFQYSMFFFFNNNIFLSKISSRPRGSSAHLIVVPPDAFVSSGATIDLDTAKCASLNYPTALRSSVEGMWARWGVSTCLGFCTRQGLGTGVTGSIGATCGRERCLICVCSGEEGSVQTCSGIKFATFKSAQNVR